VKIKGNLWMSLLMSFFFTLIVILSLGYPEKARLVPLVVAVPGLILSLVQLVYDLIGRPDKSQKDADEKDKGYSAMANQYQLEEEEMSATEVRKREWLMVAWIVFFLVIILLFGFWISIAAIILLFTRFYGKESWKMTLILTGAGWLSIYLIFWVILQVPLFEGFLFK
jgi:hypothetical protein